MQDEVDHEKSEQNEVERMKKRADCTGNAMHIFDANVVVRLCLMARRTACDTCS